MWAATLAREAWKWLLLRKRRGPRYRVFSRRLLVDRSIAERHVALEQLCRRHRVARLELFGSAARGDDLAPGSDIDFLVEFEPLPPGTYADTYFDLLEALEQLFGRSVDLVVASAIKNPYFRESVERAKALVYAA
ncbi:MAG: hypothetical protein GEV06_24260 [Luteitalea sp.]|nr:hypothetical protein [Luteitalea sp.]